MAGLILCACLLVLAAFSKAVADTLKDHFDTSVFKNKDRRFWDPSESWKEVGFIRFTKYRPDAWHLANSGMIVCFCALVIPHRPLINLWVDVLIAGALFNLVFNLFYNKILYRK